MEFRRVKLSDIVPYENNPRINEGAIEPVKKSIEEVGYISPIIIDEDNVILAGHTRYLALKEMGADEVDCVIISGMTFDQKRKYRILDNKTAEEAEWDNDLLKIELDGLDLDGIDWFDDLTSTAVSELSTENPKKENPKKEKSELRCPRCGAVVED